MIAVKVINVQQKTTIIEYFEKVFKDTKVMDHKTMVDLQKRGNGPLSLLVKDGVINQDQAAVIARILPRPMHMPRRKGWGPFHRQIPPDPEKMKAELQKKLDDLVGLKVITDKQKVTILKYFSVKFDKMKDRKLDAHSGKNKDLKGERKGPLNLLVKDGVISQEQADAIAKALFQPQVPMDKGANPEPSQP